ncbi:MAG: hypothetical protein HOY69_04260 [Streptomyces sp.]|nr:hypothetical protein [Streptomyces sp.]
MDTPDDTHMTPDLPPRVGTPDLTGQGGPRADGAPPRHDEPVPAPDGPAEPPRTARRTKAPRGSGG